MTGADKQYAHGNGNGNDNDNGCCGGGGDTSDLAGGQFEDKGQTPLTRLTDDDQMNRVQPPQLYTVLGTVQLVVLSDR